MDTPIRDPEVLSRMQVAMELYQAAEEMMRQNLRRWHPHESEEEIERRLLSWLRKEDDSETWPPHIVAQSARPPR
jgi:Rv0078B-related antitoxin